MKKIDKIKENIDNTIYELSVLKKTVNTIIKGDGNPVFDYEGLLKVNAKCFLNAVAHLETVIDRYLEKRKKRQLIGWTKDQIAKITKEVTKLNKNPDNDSKEMIAFLDGKEVAYQKVMAFFKKEQPEIKEGAKKKGGVNEKPKTPRPSAPEGQGDINQ